MKLALLRDQLIEQEQQGGRRADGQYYSIDLARCSELLTDAGAALPPRFA